MKNTKLIHLIIKYDRTNGGYEYLEYDIERMVYKEGVSRSHSGHYQGLKIELVASNKKEVKEIKQQLIRAGFTEDLDFDAFLYGGAKSE